MSAGAAGVEVITLATFHVCEGHKRQVNVRVQHRVHHRTCTLNGVTLIVALASVKS